jgi:hypothetical protein
VSDVVAVGLITGLSGIAVAAISAVVTSKVSRRSAEAAISTANSNAEVELAKIEAENERLRRQHREDERRNRQDTYHRFLNVCHRIERYSRLAPSELEFENLLGELAFLHEGILLFGDGPVADNFGVFTAVIERIESDASQTSTGTHAERWIAAYRENRTGLIQAQGMLLSLMRKDVTR